MDKGFKFIYIDKTAITEKLLCLGGYSKKVQSKHQAGKSVSLY